MAQLLSISIDVTKIKKERLYKGEKGTYLKLTVSVNDEADQFGNTVSAYEEQTKEERDAKAQKNYLGNGKVFWSNENKATAAASPTPANTHAPADDNLPF